MASKRRYTSKQVVEILQNIESYESESDSDSSCEEIKGPRTNNMARRARPKFTY